MMRYFLCAASMLALTACATAPKQVSEGSCDFGSVKLSADFEGGKLGPCAYIDGAFETLLTPENTPINDSPWYAFDIKGSKNKAVKLTLTYKDGTHRYPPKILGEDGEWSVLNTTVEVSKDETRAVFSVIPNSNSVRVAAQAVFSPKDHKVWMDKMAALDFVELNQIGTSVENRPIYKLEEIDAPGDDNPYLVIVGRQHPPETTGAESLAPFVETLWGDTELAQEFRAEFNVIVIPLINPDGVANGYWRHNVSGLDLNRDWGPFTQPETQSVEKEFTRFKSGNDDISVFLDFHSTWRNLIYTQTDAESNHDLFTRDWIANVKDRLSDDVYSFTREANKTSERPVSKNYMYRTYGIPAMTFEIGDNTDTESINTASEVFAEELMRLMLERKNKP